MLKRTSYFSRDTFVLADSIAVPYIDALGNPRTIDAIAYARVNVHTSIIVHTVTDNVCLSIMHNARVVKTIQSVGVHDILLPYALFATYCSEHALTIEHDGLIRAEQR
jgi:hypothetical protein